MKTINKKIKKCPFCGNKIEVYEYEEMPISKITGHRPRYSKHICHMLIDLD